MPIRIDHALDIDASADVVWNVITDLERYGEWNTFVESATSSLEVGSPIHMKVRVLSAFAQSQNETVFSHDPGRGFCYGLARNAIGAIYSQRCHEITPTGEGRCRYESRFALMGWLSPLVRALVGRSLRRGFTDMSHGIKTRAESMGR